ncbi:MAG TPA: biopolymer transporter ExbD [Thermoanaerobaculia bacterium]|nr:biopolymer transporter ExbD [Thermoanaerobaculia bacterium]
MTLGSGATKGSVAPEMNVTPLVDVVLVLLIIFMVITPLLSKNFWIHTPKQEKEEVETKNDDPNPPLVLHVGAGRTITVNGTDVTLEELAERLRRMFAARDDHILFFDAADEAEYGFSVEVMDRAREGGAVTIAALTAPLDAKPEGASSGSDPAR